MSSPQFKYYNQNNYPNVPYPSPTLPDATIKSGGCGPTCAAMIISNLTDKIVDPVAMAAYAMKKKARVIGGTDMNLLAKALCIDYPLDYRLTNDENLLLAHLKKGGMAIANVGGDRPGYTGVFSNGGHYIVVAGLNSDDRVIVLDPGYYAGKFNLAGRKGKVTVQGNYCICDIAVLAKDTENQNPAYWLFERRVEEVPEWMKKLMAKCGKVGIIDPKANHDPNDTNVTKWFILAVAVNTALMILRAIKSGKVDETIKILEE